MRNIPGRMHLERFTSTEASAARLAEIRALLLAAFGPDFSDEDWEHALGGWHVVVAEGGAVRSHAAVVPRRLEVDGRFLRAGYVEAVATHPARRREGLASSAMAELSRVLAGAFELGALSTSAHEFYRRLGWERWRGPTYVRDGARLVRSPDEDDGIMVLRFGATQDLDLTGPIICEARRGDAW